MLPISNKQIYKSAIINASTETLWAQWTTQEGLKSFFGKDNKVELRIGGPYEIYFLMENPEGLRESEGCQILSYIPKRMLSFSWNAPPEFKDIRNSAHYTWVVIYFHPIGNAQTELTLTHLGWPDVGEPNDKDWNEVYVYFNNAWAIVLQWLANSHKTNTL
jgi:uncharacterized protein YndB with AHSA1/START domain